MNRSTKKALKGFFCFPITLKIWHQIRIGWYLEIIAMSVIVADWDQWLHANWFYRGWRCFWGKQHVSLGKILAISLVLPNQISEVTESLIYQRSSCRRELSFPDWPSNWLQLGALSRARWIHNLPTNLLQSWAPTRAHWPFNLLQSGALIRAQWVPHQPTNFLHLGDVFRAHWLLQSTSKLLAYRSCCQRSLTYKSLSQNTEPSQNTTHWPLRCRNSIKCLLER